MSDPVAVSVVIPVYNSGEVIADQLDALTRQSYDGPWELIIADNGCVDATVDIAVGYTGTLPIRIVDATARKGDVIARNIAVAQSNGDLVVFCDSDDVVDPDWLGGHVEQLAISDVTVGPYDMRTDMHDARGGVHAGVPMRGVYGYLGYGLSASMGVRREAFDALGGFNEDFSGGYDVEFCWRTQVEGHSLGPVRSGIVIKRKRADVGGIWKQRRRFGAADVQLFKAYRRHGMPRLVVGALKAYGWLIIHLFDLTNPSARLVWVGVASQRVGRIIGSIRYRTLYL